MKIENRGTPPEGAQFRTERDPKHGSTRAYCGVPGRGEPLVYEVSDYFWMVAESMVIQWDDIRKAHPELWLGPITRSCSLTLPLTRPTGTRQGECHVACGRGREGPRSR